MWYFEVSCDSYPQLTFIWLIISEMHEPKGCAPEVAGIWGREGGGGPTHVLSKLPKKVMNLSLLYFSHDFAKQENTTYLILALKLP
jgi:hypothetical protein